MKLLTVGDKPTTLEFSPRNLRRIGRAEARLNKAYDALSGALGGDPNTFHASTIRALGHGKLLADYVRAGRAYRELQRA